MVKVRLKVERACRCGGKKRNCRICKGDGWVDGVMSLPDVVDAVVEILRKSYPIVGRFLRKKKKRG